MTRHAKPTAPTKTFYHDPDGAKRVAREARIEDILRESRRRGRPVTRFDAEMLHDTSADAPMSTPRAELFAHTGREPVPIDELSDDALEPALEQLLDDLAEMHISVECVEDLSSRELYAYLQDEVLDAEIEDVPMSEKQWHIFTGPWDDEDWDDDDEPLIDVTSDADDVASS